MNIIERNIFRLLRTGAFNVKEDIEPMSAFKWRRLYQMIVAQNLTPVFAQGVDIYKDDERLNLPADLLEEVANSRNDDLQNRKTFGDEDIRLSSRLLNHRLKRIIKREMLSEETSMETVDLLEIIIFNVNQILNYGLSLDGIIRLGQYLRRRGDKVDFVKLDEWLKRLHLSRMAQLQGNILITVFGFEKDELPFVQQEEKNAMPLALRAVSNLAKDTAEEWYFRQTRSGFVQNNSKKLRRNIRRSMRYYNYAPMETTSSFFTNLVRSLSEIEE